MMGDAATVTLYDDFAKLLKQRAPDLAFPSIEQSALAWARGYREPTVDELGQLADEAEAFVKSVILQT
jgi:hypothetical protein